MCSGVGSRVLLDWVSPFGHPRITGRLPPPQGLSQAPTSFIGSWCQGIHRVPLKACPSNVITQHTPTSRRPPCSNHHCDSHKDHTPPTTNRRWQCLLYKNCNTFAAPRGNPRKLE